MEQFSRIRDKGGILFIATSIAAISLLTFIIYRGTLNNFFLKDDAILINEGQKRGCEATQIYFYESTDGPRRCVLGIFYKFFGRVPTGYHAVAFFMHIINTCSLFALLALFLSFLQPSARYIFSAAGALLFALQFSAHEAVLWLSGIDEILLTFFLFPCLLCFMTSLRNRNAHKLLYAASVLFYAFASLAKVATWIFPVILLSYACIMQSGKTSFFKGFRLTIPFFVISFIHVMTFLALSSALAHNMCYVQVRNGYFLYNMVYYLSDYFFSLVGVARGPFLASEMYYTTLGKFTPIVDFSRAVSVFSIFALGYLFVKGTFMRAHLDACNANNARQLHEAKKITLFGFLWMLVFFLPFACHLHAPLNDKFIEHNNLIHWRYLYFPCGGFCLMLTGFLLIMRHNSILINQKLLVNILISAFLLSTLTINGTHVWYVERMYDEQGKHAQYLTETIHKNYKSIPRDSDVYLISLPNGLQIHEASMTPFLELLFNIKINAIWVHNYTVNYCATLARNKNSYFLEYSNVGLTDTTPWRRQTCSVKK